MSTEPWRNPRPAPTIEEVRYRVPPQSLALRLLKAWWPALLWSAWIFTASTDTFSTEHTSRFVEPFLRWLFPSSPQETIAAMHHFLRKCAHFAEYFTFFLLLYRGICAGRKVWHLRWAIYAWLAATVYGCLDEFHQWFVPSRGSSPWDSLLDSIGALAALLFLLAFYRLLRRQSSS